MLLAAIAHRFSFSHKDFDLGYENTAFIKSFLDTTVPSDMVGEFDAQKRERSDSEVREAEIEERLARDRAELYEAYMTDTY